MRVLVAYGTVYGSTTVTAERIAKVLREHGAEVDVLRCLDVNDVGEYDAFIVGAPVWLGNWLRPARSFVQTHEETLSAHPTAFFHTSAAGASPEHREECAEQMRRRIGRCAPSVEPVSIGTFAGVIDYDLYNLPTRLMIKHLMGGAGGPTTGRNDFRDWEMIEAWATEVHQLFNERPA